MLQFSIALTFKIHRRNTFTPGPTGLDALAWKKEKMILQY